MKMREKSDYTQKIYNLADSIIKQAKDSFCDMDYYQRDIILSMAYGIADFAKEFNKPVKVYIYNQFLSKRVLEKSFLEKYTVIYINHLWADGNIKSMDGLNSKLPSGYYWTVLPMNFHTPFAFGAMKEE